MKEIDHSYTREIVCPYCGYEYIDSWEINQDSTFWEEEECPECDKVFEVERNIEVTYVTYKKKEFSDD